MAAHDDVKRAPKFREMRSQARPAATGFRKTLSFAEEACPTGHLDFSFFPPFRAGFGGLKPAGSGLLACSRP